MEEEEEVIVKEIMIGRVKYVREEAPDHLDYVLVRTYSAGVHAGYVKERSGKEVTLLQARRLWHWSGAASLSQLAQSGTSNPQKCKFPEEVKKIVLTEAIEILDVTEKAKQTIDCVPIWRV